MSGLSVHLDKVPEVVVRRLCLGHFVVRLGLGGMDDIGELDGVLDEEDGDVVAYDVPVALLGVKFDCKAAHITDGIGRATAS